MSATFHPRPKYATPMQAQCDDWNQKHPLGTRVLVQREEGEDDTVTQSVAYVYNGIAEIFVEGPSGPSCRCLLNQVKAIDTSRTEDR